MSEFFLKRKRIPIEEITIRTNVKTSLKLIEIGRQLLKEKNRWSEIRIQSLKITRTLQQLNNLNVNLILLNYILITWWWKFSLKTKRMPQNKLRVWKISLKYFRKNSNWVK